MVLDTIAPPVSGHVGKMSESSRGGKSPGVEAAHRRPVRSFVLRGGRLTEGQKRALEELWPRFGIEDRDALLDLEALFGNRAPVILEIGFGNGEATWRMAGTHPEENYIGVEVHRPGVGHLLLEIEKRDIANIRIACADALEFLRSRVPRGSLAGVRVYFPDPWPKKRHHKRRIIQPSTVQLLASRMQPGALLHLATDWEPYALYMLEVISATEEFTNISACGGFCSKPDWRPVTKYEKRGERLGHKVKDLLFKRTLEPGP